MDKLRYTRCARILYEALEDRLQKDYVQTNWLGYPRVGGMETPMLSPHYALKKLARIPLWWIDLERLNPEYTARRLLYRTRP